MQGGDSRTSDAPVWLHRRAGGVAIEVYAQPGARRSRIIGEHAGRLKIAVTAPPLEGRANQALLELLSQILALPVRSLAIEAGDTSRAKRIFAMTDMPEHEIALRLSERHE